MSTVSTQSTPHPRAKITPAGKSPCEVARELRDQALEGYAPAQGPITTANRYLSPRVPGLHLVPGDDEGDEAGSPIAVEPQPHWHPVETDAMIEEMNDLSVLVPMVLVAVPLEPT